MPSSDQVDSQPTRPFVGRWYLAGAVSLTVLWLVVRGFAPATGLTRSYHYPYATLDRSTEPVLELLTTPVVEERITAVDLAFIDARSHPARNYLVRWNGVWFSPRPERIDFHAAADDGVVLRLDGEVVIERNSEAGTATAVRTVELDAGAHRLDIDHWQHGGASRLHLEWAPAGGDPVPLSPSRLFPEDPGAPAPRPVRCFAVGGPRLHAGAGLTLRPTAPSKVLLEHPSSNTFACDVFVGAGALCAPVAQLPEQVASDQSRVKTVTRPQL